MCCLLGWSLENDLRVYVDASLAKFPGSFDHTYRQTQRFQVMQKPRRLIFRRPGWGECLFQQPVGVPEMSEDVQEGVI